MATDGQDTKQQSTYSQWQQQVGCWRQGALVGEPVGLHCPVVWGIKQSDTKTIKYNTWWHLLAANRRTKTQQ